MKVTILVGLVAVAALSSHAVASTSAPLVLEPGTLLEELRTEVITVRDGRLTTELGAAVSLKLIKTVEIEHLGVRLDYEVVDTDAVRFCDDGSEANYLGLTVTGTSVALGAYQKRTNPKSNSEYVSQCGDYFYLLKE